jgi:crotonobetainyl-CoA:carnitine CoA-transferase CaiB-like acyl-CoA transferase
MLLANAGAEVIKVEPPRRGEKSRNSGHELGTNLDEPVTLQYVRVNRGKRGVTLNLKDEAGKALFKRLVEVSDVLVENFRPGTMARLGLGYEELKQVNPRLVYAAISGYGQRADLKGPYSSWPANNPAAQAMSGLMDITGEPGGPPSMVGASIGDTIPGIWTAYSIMLALAQRDKTGVGQFLDMSMYDCLVMHNDVAVAYYNAFGVVPGRERQDMWSPQLRLETNDGYVVISGSVPQLTWSKLWIEVGRPDLADKTEYLGLKVNGPFLIQVVKPILEEWTRTKTKAELCRLLLGLGFSASMVQTAKDVADCPQLEARHMFHEFELGGKAFRLPGDPVKMSNVPESPGLPPPLLGQDNQDIFGELLGLGTEEVQHLTSAGVL